MRRAAKKDGNHHETIEHLEANGWCTADTSGLGYGFPDSVVTKRGSSFTALLEIKNGNLPPSARRLTEAEQKFRDNWTGPYVLAVSPEDALTQLEALYSRTLYE